MWVLHIANSYGGTEVYTRLIQELDGLGIKQTIFVPLNPNNRIRKGNFPIEFRTIDSLIIYSTELELFHRYFYNLKIKKILSEIEKHIDLTKIDLIHAGLFTSDGAVAYELSKKYSIPFIVAIRNTDVNVYYKQMWWKRRYFHSILESSSSAIFISHAYKKLFAKMINDKIEKFEEKSVVIPNGLNPYFLENKTKEVKKINNPVRIVYAGAFNKGKNILEVIKALEILLKKGYLIKFNAIGKGLEFRNEEEKYINEIYRYTKNKNWVTISESLSKKELLLELKKNDIFVMPSAPETFGLIYLEALSQGLPIIYANGEGFDGFYHDKYIGLGVDHKDPGHIATGIEQIINDYNQIASNVFKLNLRNDFQWLEIAKKYLKLYKQVTYNTRSISDLS